MSNICKFAFYRCKHLEKLTIAESVEHFEEDPFVECFALKKIVYKSKKIRMSSAEDAAYLGSELGLKGLPCQDHIYLQAENPEDVCFDMFNSLDNIGEVTLHVPRSCKKKYEDYEVRWADGSTIKAYLWFHHIEEYDL